MKRGFNIFVFGISTFILGLYVCEYLNGNSIPLYKWGMVTFFGIMWFLWANKNEKVK